MNRKTLFQIGLYTLACLSAFGFSHSAQAIERLTDSSVNRAIAHGLEYQEMGLNSFLGGNWIEGQEGALLNIYTPWMELARSAAHRDMPTQTTPENIAATRKKMVEDIHYVWHHPNVKFMVSLYGDTSDFSRRYFARIEGVGRGKSVRLYPQKSIPQYLATKEENATSKPFSAINSYQFRFEDVAPLEEFTLILYGDKVEPITFRVYGKNID